MNIAVILAGGKGLRMKSAETPKQFIDVYGKPIVIHTIEKFDNHPMIDSILVACIPEWIEDLRGMLKKFDIKKVKWIVEGGETRQESVFNAVTKLQSVLGNDDIVLVHDAVRPLITSKIIDDNIEGAINHGAVDTVIPATDTIIRTVDSCTISSVPARNELYLGQTPQSFKYSILKNAHMYSEELKIRDASDDCQLVLQNKQDVYLIAGDKLNFKITTVEDLLLLKAILKLSS